MTENIKTAFESICAENELKNNTLVLLKNEIKKKTKKQKAFKIYATAFASAAAIFLSVFIYFTPAAYVDMDVNPSIELTLNHLKRVIAAKPYNDDGAEILSNVAVHNKAYDKAVQALLNEMIRNGNLAQDNLISITVQTENNNTAQKILTSLQTEVTALLNINHQNAATDFFTVSEETRHHAHDYNLSPAKYIAITELQKLDPTATYNSCASHSISEIKQLMHQHENNHHQEQSNDDTENGCRGMGNMNNESKHQNKKGHHQ